MSKLMISSEEYTKIVSAEKATQDKRTSRKLKVLMLRYEEYDNQTIAERLDISSTRVTHLVEEYFKNGLEEYTRKKYGGNHRNMSVEEKMKFLKVLKTRQQPDRLLPLQKSKKLSIKSWGATQDADTFICS